MANTQCSQSRPVDISELVLVVTGITVGVNFHSG